MNETPDQAKTRRRWITLAELVAVAGVIIAALGFWNSWSERRDAQAERAQAASEASKKARFILKGEVAPDHKSVLLTSDDDHALSDVRVSFPHGLGVAPQDVLSDAIPADWVAKPLLKMTDGSSDARTGRLPVLLSYTYTDPDGQHAGRGTYDLIWQTRPGSLPFQGRQLTLTNFRLRQEGGTQATLDRLWTKP